MQGKKPSAGVMEPRLKLLERPSIPDWQLVPVSWRCLQLIIWCRHNRLKNRPLESALMTLAELGSQARGTGAISTGESHRQEETKSKTWVKAIASMSRRGHRRGHPVLGQGLGEGCAWRGRSGPSFIASAVTKMRYVPVRSGRVAEKVAFLRSLMHTVEKLPVTWMRFPLLSALDWTLAVTFLGKILPCSSHLPGSCIRLRPPTPLSESAPVHPSGCTGSLAKCAPWVAQPNDL
jgi:hypothetical protein